MNRKSITHYGTITCRLIQLKSHRSFNKHFSTTMYEYSIHINTHVAYGMCIRQYNTVFYDTDD